MSAVPRKAVKFNHSLIWATNKFIAYKGVTYIRGLMVGNTAAVDVLALQEAANSQGFDNIEWVKTTCIEKWRARVLG